jgi:hypothetical protein
VDSHYQAVCASSPPRTTLVSKQQDKGSETDNTVKQAKKVLSERFSNFREIKPRKEALYDFDEQSVDMNHGNSAKDLGYVEPVSVGPRPS